MKEEKCNSEEPKCRCGDKGNSAHICPYAKEINDSDRECNCCSECTHQCAMDI